MSMQDTLDRYSRFHRVDEAGQVFSTQTAYIRIGEEAWSALPGDLDLNTATARLALFWDHNTKRVAGDSVLACLEAAGFTVDVYEFLEDDEGLIIADDARVLWTREKLSTQRYDHAVAVGAGTINDLVKMASFQVELPYSTVPTAASMNGYTSAIAAILSEGVKTTQPCHAPIGVYAAPTVVATAPYRMTASGLGDLYSKPVSNADWRLSHRLLGSPYSPIVMEIVEAGGALLQGVAPKLPSGDTEAVSKLLGALMLSGLAMQAGGSSQSASGAEHLISHYIDMTAFAFNQPHDLHGCQVAVGTMVSSRLYEAFRALDPETIDVEARVAAHIEWEDYEPMLRQRFGSLQEAVLKHAGKMYPTKEEVRERLTLLRANWSSIIADVSKTLRPSMELRDELRSAQVPTGFSELGVDAGRALDAVRFCKDIRARYTILHLASELGILDDLAAELIRD